MDNSRFTLREEGQHVGRPLKNPWLLTDTKTGWVDHFRTKEGATQYAEQLEREDKIAAFVVTGLYDLQVKVADRFQLTPLEALRHIKKIASDQR